MKYATFKDFIKDARYHGADLGTLELDFKLDDNHIAPNLWRHTLHTQINLGDYEAAEKWIHVACNWVRIPGVITYLPTEDDVKRAYSMQHELQVVERGG